MNSQNHVVDAITILAQGVPGYQTAAFAKDATGRTFTPACPKCHSRVPDKKVWVQPAFGSTRTDLAKGEPFEAVVWCDRCVQFTAMQVSKDKGGTLIQGNAWKARNPSLLTSKSVTARSQYLARRLRSALTRLPKFRID